MDKTNNVRGYLLDGVAQCLSDPNLVIHVLMLLDSGAGDTAPSPGPFSAFIHQNQSPPSTSVVKTFSLANRLPSLIVGRYLMTHFVSLTDRTHSARVS